MYGTVEGMGGYFGASERIKGAVNGVGSLKYGGHPKQKQLERNGIGATKEL